MRSSFASAAAKALADKKATEDENADFGTVKAGDKPAPPGVVDIA